MTEPGHDIMIKDALVFFVAAGLIVPALRVVKLPTVIAFILAGVAGRSSETTPTSMLPTFAHALHPPSDGDDVHACTPWVHDGAPCAVRRCA